MAGYNTDGVVELEFNMDHTQVVATIYPPRAVGRALRSQEVLDKLRTAGVLYGIREDAIKKAVRDADEMNRPVRRVLVAEGILPQDGADAHVSWQVPEERIREPLPRRSDGPIDYFSLQPADMVQAGQLLASVSPARHGTPGKSLVAPLSVVHQRVGKQCNMVAGAGVVATADRLKFFAETDGVVELKGDQLTVHALQILEGDLPVGTHDFPTGLVIHGDVKGTILRANGAVAVKGVIAGGTIRAHGDVLISRAARANIITDGTVYVLGTLLHCEVNTIRKIVALDGATLIGGKLIATSGIEAASLGSQEGVATGAIAGVDGLSALRMEELDHEIASSESNILRIGQALRPLTSVSAEGLPDAKRQLVQALLEQRRQMETRIRELHNEKRTLMMASKQRTEATITVSGTVYPGVSVRIGDASANVKEERHGVAFVVEGRETVVAAVPLSRAA